MRSQNPNAAGVMLPRKWCSLPLLFLAITVANAQDWNCQSDTCEGHRAGYSWGMSHEATESDCVVAGTNTNSPSFTEGCKSAVEAKAWMAARQQLTPAFQAYDLGIQFAKTNRALPTDCQQVYESLKTSLGEWSVPATFFQSGCLEQAKKQAKRVIKENEKRAKDAEKEAQKKTQAPN